MSYESDFPGSAVLPEWFQHNKVLGWISQIRKPHFEIFVLLDEPHFPLDLIGPYKAGPKSALFLRMVLIRAGVNGADVQKAIFKGEKNIL